MDTFKEVTKTFRIHLTADKAVSQEAIRQYSRCVVSIIDGKPIYRVTDPRGKVTYHATISDITRYLYSKGFVGVQASNIHQAARQQTMAYNHVIEKLMIDKKEVDLALSGEAQEKTEE